MPHGKRQTPYLDFTGRFAVGKGKGKGGNGKEEGGGGREGEKRILVRSSQCMGRIDVNAKPIWTRTHQEMR